MQDKYFTLERIGELVGKNPATVRTHINRGYVTGQGPRATTNKKPGKHERFSIHSLIEFALAYRIESAGVGLKEAFKYAAQFAHAGDTDYTSGSTSRRPERYPGLPFHHRHGVTYMGMMSGQSVEIADGEASLNSLRFTLCRMTNSPDSTPMITMNMTAFFNEICAALGEDYRVILDAIYGEAD